MTKAGFLFGAALALTVTVAPGTQAAENIDSANYVLPNCRDIVNNKLSGDLPGQGFCAGSVRAIAFMGAFVNVALKFNPDSDRTTLAKFIRETGCLDIPEGVGVTGIQQIRVVIAYIEARPARMHELFDILALEALRAAWPCPPRDYPPISLPPVIVPDLLHNEAMALAQLVKRLGHDDVERLSSRFDGGHERDLMLAGIDKLQRALAEAGFAPR
jgi:hypothetical protein